MRPVKWSSGIKWPWIMTEDQRIAEANACRAERLDADLLDRVLEERNMRTNVKRKKRQTF